MIYFQPLEQFEVIFLGSLFFIPISNATLYFFLLYLFIRIFSWVVLKREKKQYVIGHTWQAFFEYIYLFVFNLIKQQVGLKGYPYFPLFFTLFIFILGSNLLGMTFYSFTITSHAVVTFSLALAFFIGIVIVGIITQSWKWLNTFVPSGLPTKALVGPMVVIEAISYFSRPISLAIRLFANMMSGHTLLAILSNFTIAILKKSFLIGLIPFFIIVIIIGLEIMIALLQAYVFTILLCLYLNDSLHGSH